MVAFLITNGGPHPADKWAEITAKDILDMIQIGEPRADQTIEETVAAMNARKAKRLLEPVLVNIFEESHTALQQHERGKLGAKGERCGVKRLEIDIDAAPHCEGPFAKVIAAMKGTPFEAHFNTPDAQAHLRAIIKTRKSSVMHIERSWYADQNAGAKEAKAFKARFNPK